ncbi:hypothetical protein [Calothrix sp. 336/3]|uniref:hypothetical protein n=1 Tax=Calothrix sp. 336/3 TaxID=1337936 RepID=UPI0004E42CE5|nr:hypothetical protein [Calothrix sp. 336/3]AKG20146.1 hypothetical protein IJ00_01435 [Calothrix sp. 336/3]
MVAIFSKGVSISGVTAYQDSEKANQFFYHPTAVRCILGETLQDFKVTYWGIGKPFFVQRGNRIDSVVGAILSGRAVIDITKEQRQQLIERINRVYNLKNPALLPLPLSQVRVRPVIADKALYIDQNSDIKFPETIQLGTSFNYLISTGNSLFAQFAATQGEGNKVIPNPSFGINLSGYAEFQGDPWIVEVEANLSQVWSYVRRRISAGLSLGWFKLKFGDYDKLIQDMRRDKIIKLTLIEGSLDNERYGRQFLEMGKQIFEAVNQQVNSSVEYFKFEPSVNQTNNSANTLDWAKALWSWDVSINLAYGEQSLRFAQSLVYKQRISYSGRFNCLIPAAMTLAVTCNNASRNMFQDLGYPNEPCITQAKAEEMQKRLQMEFERKKPLLDKLYERFVLEEISQEQYDRAMRLLNGISARESMMLLPADSPILADDLHEKYRLGEQSFVLGLSDWEIEELLAVAMAN